MKPSAGTEPKLVQAGEPLREYYPEARGRARALMDRTLSGRRLSNADLVAELEITVAERTAARHCIAVASATAGLILAIRALASERDGDVLIPVFAFSATALAPLWAGKGVFCLPVDPGHFNLCKAAVAEALSTRRVAAIVAIGVAGNPSGLAGVAAEARRTGTPLIIDAAACMGAVPTFGDAVVVSMSARKALPAGEGGLVFTGSDVLAQRLRRMRQYGSTDGFFCLERGLNARLSEVHAALALAHLPLLDNVLARRALVADNLRRRLAALGAVLQASEPVAAPAWNDVLVRVPGRRRQEIIGAVRELGVEAVPFYDPPVHRHPAFASQFTVEWQGRQAEQELLFSEIVGIPVLSSTDDARCAEIASAFAAGLGEPGDGAERCSRS